MEKELKELYFQLSESGEFSSRYQDAEGNIYIIRLIPSRERYLEVKYDVLSKLNVISTITMGEFSIGNIANIISSVLKEINKR